MAYEDIEDSSGSISYIILFLSVVMLYCQGGCDRMIDKSQVLKLTNSNADMSENT
jgi:hypothetical protein